MGSNNLSVSITADIADMQSKFAVARAETNALTAEMNRLAKASAQGIIDPAGSVRLQQVSGDMLRARAQTAGLADELQKAGISGGGFGSRMKTEAAGVGQAFEGMQGKINAALQFTGIGLAVEAVHKLMEAVSAASQSANEIRSMSEVLGVTTAQFQAMEIASEEAGISSEQMFRAQEKLVTILNEARDGSGGAIEKLKALGITNEQIRDTSFGAAQMMAYLSGRLNDSQTATTTMAAMTRELGARAAIAAEGIKQLGSNTEEWNKKAAEANSLSEGTLSRLHEIGAWWGNVGREIHNATSQAIVWTADNSGILKTAAQMVPQLGSMARAFDLVGDAQSKAGHAEGTIDRSGAVAAQTTTQAAALAAVQAGNSAITKATLDGIRDQIEGTKQGSAERLNLVRQFYQDSLKYYGSGEVDKVREAHRQLVAEQRQHGEELLREAQKNASDLVAATREKASEIMAQENLSKAQQLAAVRSLYADELQSATLTKEKRVEVERSLNESITAINREAASTRQAIARADVTADLQIARLTLDAKRSELEAEIQANQISASKKLTILRGLATSEEAMNQKALEDELATLDPLTAEYRRVYDEIRVLKAKLNLDLAGLDKQYAADVARQAREEVTLRRAAINELESAEGSLVSNLLGKRQSMSASILQIGGELITKEISNDAKAMTARVLIKDAEIAKKNALEQGGFLYRLLFPPKEVASATTAEAAKTTAASTAAATRNTVATAAAVESMTQAATINTALVMSNAAVAAAGAFAATAMIPYVGPVLAPGIAAASYAEVAAFAPMASLDVGAWNVPRDMTANIHKGESVVPTPFAEGMRQNGGFGGTAGGGATTHNYGDIHMSDTNMKRLLSSRAGQRMVFDGLASAYRRGAR